MKVIDNLIHKAECIAEGWKNSIFKRVTIEEVADIRRKICMVNTCGQYSTKIITHCSDCGCPIEKKIRSLKNGCGLGYWGCIKEVDLAISYDLFKRSDFFVDKLISKSMVRFRHRRNTHVVIVFDMEKQIGIVAEGNLNLWKDVQEYYKEKTTQNLN